MKGVGFMKNVCLRFIGTGYKSFCQADVKIYDSNDCLIAVGTTYNGCLNVSLCINEVYYVVATTTHEKLFASFRVRENRCDYRFVFNSAFVREPVLSETIIFSLTDAYYPNMPIERGRLILWQNQ